MQRAPSRARPASGQAATRRFSRTPSGGAPARMSSRVSRGSWNLFPVQRFDATGRTLAAQECRMQPKFKRPTYLELISHSAMGAALGLSLALVLLVLDTQQIFEMIVNSSAPELTMLVFLGTFTLSFTVGATITGWLFIAHDS
jgi:hypothetical protein